MMAWRPIFVFWRGRMLRLLFPWQSRGILVRHATPRLGDDAMAPPVPVPRSRHGRATATPGGGGASVVSAWPRQGLASLASLGAA